MELKQTTYGLSCGFFALILFLGSTVFGEQQTTISLSSPVLTPGTSGSFSATQVTGPAATMTATLVNPFANILEYQLTNGTGRFAGLNGQTRYGLQFDAFQIFQSFIDTTFLTVVSSATACPSAGSYTWLLIHMRSPEALRSPMNVASTSARVGGVLNYNTSAEPFMSSSSAFDLVGPTNYSTSYNLDSTAYGACSSGVLKATNATAPPLDQFGRFFFGNTMGMYFGGGGNPLVATLVPVTTLTSGGMSSFSTQVLSGLYTSFTTQTTQVQNNVYVVPDVNGTTYTLKTINNYGDPTNYTTYATIACTNLNSPSNGFCSGTITLASGGGSGNAVCQIGNPANQYTMSCAFQTPNSTTVAGSLIATQSTTSLIAVTLPTTIQNINSGSSSSVVATIQNLTGTYISTMADPSTASLKLQPPFADTSAYTASNGGTCLGTLAGYASCTVNITYSPTANGMSMQNFRVAYNNQSATVNASAALTEVSGLQSIVVTPNTAYVPQGGTQQYTATAHYADGSTQNITNGVTWSSNTPSVASINSSGLASLNAAGSFTITATYVGISGTVSSTVYIVPPDPTGLTATPNSYSQITLNWTSGGGSTTAFQVAYQTGSTAPTSCTAGTVITAGVIGAATSYAVTGLTPGTLYAFRVCSENGSAGQFSNGVTATATTVTAHTAFATAGLYNGNLGGLYFADYVCQNEATSAGRTGTWRAVMGDNSTSAVSRITLSQSIYNTRPTSSGGAQLVSTSANFWNTGSVSFINAINYNASGGSPGSGNVWTGATATGAIQSAKNCTSWTTSAPGVTAEYGLSTAVNATSFANNTQSCNTTYDLYCINLQTSAATPPDATNFTWYSRNTTSINFSWASGGGTTAAYTMAYQTGATAPANCNSGTIIPAATLGLNPTGYTLAGLTTNTQYSFRLCAQNSDLTATSAGATLTVSTTASGSVTNLNTTQVVFSTTGTYNGSFGGLYFGDYICQAEAISAGISGIWKAILSDDSTSAVNRINMPGAVYNFRPSSAGGIQQVAPSSASFWGSAILYSMQYNASGSTPGNTVDWTGSNATGTNISGTTCSSWTTASSATRGEYGNGTSNNELSNGNNPCNNTYSLYCTNQQTSSAAPPDVASFVWYVASTNSISFNWATGGGTTGAYELAYQVGSAPSSCTSGTVIPPATLGVNATTYTVPGLSASTTYGFRLCALNSDLSASSAGLTIVQATQASGQGPLTNLSGKQVVFSTATTRQGNFGGLYFADFVCQNEANANSLGGIWKAILSDDSTTAISRISIPGVVYNNRSFSNGGIQLEAANSASFWSSSFPYSFYYNGGGSNPGSVTVWTGTTAAGANISGSTCSSWTTSTSTASAEDGNGNTTGNAIATGTNNCGNAYSLYCTNQQSAAAAPAAPTGFTWSNSSDTAISLTWASGGGTTAGYQLAYQTGTAPASCTTGTVVSPVTLGVNPLSYSLTGLTAGTTYGFTLCAVNSDQSAFSSVVSFSVATQPSGSGTVTNLGTKQIVFESTTLTPGNFGGLYFGDFVCQNEAAAAGLGGVWKAILSDETTSAVSRIAIAGNVYNNRPTSSGGYQLVAPNGTSFWSGSMAYSLQYNASGTAPGSTVAWTGSTQAGAIIAGQTCASWTTNSSGNSAEYANNNNGGNEIANGGTNCNNSWGLYCTNQQTAAAAPSAPTGLTYSVSANNYITLAWASGGGTTAGYQLSYQSGTAPANCKSGTIITPAALGINPTGYSVTGLTASTTYGFALCAVNSDQSQFSSSVTYSIATQSSSSSPVVNLGTKQVMFSTAGGWAANFGGLYFGDFICQNEANAQSLGGVWKAVLSDDSTSAISRLVIPGAVYNNRPVSSGGLQLIANSSASFWGSSFPYTTNYSAAGSSPASNVSWTGSTAAGAISTGQTCTSWTTNNNTLNGFAGVNTTTGNEIGNGTNTCNTSNSLYCLNQQTASAAPPDATSFTWYTVSNSGISLTWASGGGTTAGYQIAFQAGAAPASCTAGNVVTPTAIGVNPTSYSITGLSASTTYGFRLCAVNSDQSQLSTGVTFTQATVSSSSSPITNLGTKQIVFETASLRQGNFGGIYYGDFVCQNEAVAAGFTGSWKAILSDDSTQAISRIVIPGAVYNNRPTGSGGQQLVATNSAAFWSGSIPYSLQYNASGTSPGSTVAWTGTNSVGTNNVGNTCTSWTSNLNSVNAVYANNGGGGNEIGNGTTACNNNWGFYCINQQTSSAAPPDATSFSNYSTASTAIGFTFASGGGTTAGFELAYIAGTTAPSANCNSGTIVPAATLGVNPTSYTLTGLSASTTYSFRLCAVNSDGTSISNGLTLSSITTQSGSSAPVVNYGSTQVLFTTSANYNANFGGLYFADYICQQEATNGGLPGTWRALLSDDSTGAASRITLSANTYNNRPVGSGGIQLLSNSANFWNALYPYSLRYTATGAIPTSNVPWTGSNSNGTSKTGNTCSSWTTLLNTSVGEYGVSNNLNSTSIFDNSNTPCNNTVLNLYCINQQSSAAAPAAPTGFSAGTVTTTTVPLSWTNGGGTTAAFQIAYTTGATAPASCSSGTLISASGLGINPSTYTVTGLSSGTQYTFLLCSANSDLTRFTPVATAVTATTTALATTANQTVFATANTYRASMGGIYFADYICQAEALSGALSGIWKAVISNDSTTAVSRITLASTIYNNRPAGSGGPQSIATSANFWSGTGHAAGFNYNAAGGAPGSNNTWSGSTAAGAINTGNTCTGWTTNTTAANGEYGQNTQTSSANEFALGTANCNNTYSLYCINQQTSSAAPSNPATFTAYETGSTSIGFAWTSGGGTTAAYQMSYQTGATAPATCATGTIVAAGAMSLNPNSYTVTGLSAGTQYSFRLCAANSDLSSFSSGITATVATQTTGSPTVNTLGTNQFIFNTAGAYTGYFGGLYYGDFICQNEAATAGLSGVWKAVLSDGTTAATSHVTIGGNVFNFRPINSGGAQKVSDATNFYNTFYNAVNYTGSGATASSTNEWSGSTNAGASAATTCTAWTTQSSSTSGEVGNNNSTNNPLAAGTATCNNSRPLFCTNQQTASAAPPNPASFANYELSTTSAGFVWASGGGTTAAFQLAYQTGSSAPATCSTGTIISAATLGINPSTYAVSGLTANTTYSFRLCAENSDLSSASTGLTLTLTTSSAGTSYPLGSTQFVFPTSSVRNGAFGGVYYGDYICQTEAASAGLPGVWRSVLSDASNAASSHITLSGNIYNFAPQSSGGSQKVSDSSSFFNNVFYNTPYYTAVGLTPSTTGVWTGATFAGATTSNNCSSWTSLAPTANGESGRSNTTGNVLDTGNNTCNNNFTLYCINQQSAAAAPGNAATFTSYSQSSNSIGLLWTSGGTTTAAYQLAYQTGSAPASCTTGTVVSAGTLGVNPSTYVVNGLTSGTTYYFRLCSLNSDLSATSAGITYSVATTSSGQTNSLGSAQFMFATTSVRTGAFGGVYFGDYVCQSEAATAGLPGTWKSVLSDNTNAANARIVLTGNVFNFRPLSSGGAQKVTDSTNFWAGTSYNNDYYTALGLTPSTTAVWTGSNYLGNTTANNCSSWTANAPTLAGETGRSNTTGSLIDNTNNTCNNNFALYCINQQGSSATPPNPATFAPYEIGSTSVGFAWTSGGGSTAAYQIAYQAGTSAPANCNSGTVIAASILGINPASYTVTGLTAGTTYSFLLCALNSDLSAQSAGIASTSVTTTASGQSYPLGTDQFIFTTTSNFTGAFGGIYFGDFICQNDANTAGLPGIWKAVLSDNSNPASSHISLTGNMYNFRPLSAGGAQKVSDSNNFFSGTMYNTVTYTSLGVLPSTNTNWTGSSYAGAVTGNSCNNWTTVSSATIGVYGVVNSANLTVSNNSNTSNCNNSYGLYCVNQQTASAAPPNPATFAQYLLGPNNVGFNFSSGGGTTAGYQIAYQTGATAPANCSSGTVILPSTIGINPTVYSVTGLTANTQYSFRLCAVNSDSSSLSSGVTLSAITTETAAAPITQNLSALQVMFATATTYEGYFGGIYYGDFICQNEASGAGLPGTWRAVLGDDTNNPSSHIALTGNAIYNSRGASAGGIQQISNGTGFYSGPYSTQANYSASGGPPGNVVTWTGSLNTGLSNVGTTCSSWTTAANTTNGEVGAATVPQNGVSWTQSACSNFYSLYCINQQSSAAAPPDATNFVNYSASSTSLGFTWTPSGGTTAAFQIAYQTGSSAPSSCTAGTVVSATTLGVNPSTYTVTGLTPGTTYSFRLCAENSDLTASSSGQTLTSVSTTPSGNTFTPGSTQFIFSTAGAYYPIFGGIYFADYICQNEANSGGLAGTWKAIIGDNTNTANSHVSMSGNIYNTRTGASGGSQFVSNGSSFFTSDTLSAQYNYSSTGGAPGNAYAWTGANQSGSVTGNSCTNWTSGANAANGTIGRDTSTTNYVGNTTTSCNSTRSLFCTNQQTSSATPPDVTNFWNYITGSTYAGFTWNSGGGTTAAYQMSYQSGGTAPASCTVGTVVSAATLGINVSSYTVSGLSPSTTYSFRICAENSDLSSASGGVTLTLTTPASTVIFTPATDQFIFTTAAVYTPNFGSIYWGDYICQNEAVSAGLNGTWKALIGDDSTAATSHTTMSGNLYNLRLPSAGGAQAVSNSATFFTGALQYPLSYTAAGGTPGNTRTWTGMANAGALNNSHTCSSWTSNSAAQNAAVATDTALTTNTYVNIGNVACNTSYSLYCINQQTPSATPPEVAGAATGTVTASSVQFTWTAGSGDTAGYQISYQVGGTAPADCASGTVISAFTIGLNPTGYTVTGLSNSTQYSFRICAENSDQSQPSVGITKTVTAH